MMFWKTFAVVLSLTPSAFASSYIMAAQAPKAERTRHQNAIDSTIPVHFPKQKCTGVFVGRTGELLTNLHCVEPCLQETPATLQTEKLTDSEVRLMRPTKEAIGHRCPLRFGKKLADGNAEILAIFGPGWIEPREALTLMALFAPEQVTELMSNGFEGRGDLVLVRLRTAATAAANQDARMTSPACAELSEDQRDPVPNVLGLAYPLLARKTDNPFAPLLTLGTTLMWTRGEMTADANTYDKNAEIGEAKDALKWMFPGGTLMSSIDGEKGASGSPVFDELDRVVAIVRSTWKAEGTNYIPWRTQAVDLRVHRSAITQALGANACR
ncbi:MAG: trypsin-like peptidase domain-containing protein [Bdellovibrionaceae bacterium]|nr:trypsin-like peptidase domain-containing protein [Pseudobdellovibrionaceae bacterium]